MDGYEVGQDVEVEIRPLVWGKGQVSFVGTHGLAVKLGDGQYPFYVAWAKVRHIETGDDDAKGG